MEWVRSAFQLLAPSIGPDATQFRVIVLKNENLFITVNMSHNEGFSTIFAQSVDDVLDNLEDQVDDREMQYDSDTDHIVIGQIVLVVRRANPENGAASTMRRSVATETWLIPGEYQTQQNCFYFAMAMLKNSERFVEEYANWLEGNGKYPQFANAATMLKRNKKKALKRRIDGVPDIT